jgi:regulatory protein
MIEAQKKHKGRYNLYVNDQFALGVDENVLLKYGLSKGKEVTNEFLEEVIKAEELGKGFNYAINLLSYRARSQREIMTKMKEKGYDGSMIEKVLEKLQEYGYINDYQFSQQWVSDKQKSKKAGKNLLKQELFQKGIDRDVIQQVIDENVHPEEEYGRAYELAEKKMRTLQKEDRKSKYRKLSGVLARKGYTFDIISKVLKEIL